MAHDRLLDDVKACCALRTPTRVPVFGVTGEFDVKQTGISRDLYGRDAKTMAQCQIDMAHRYSYDWIFLIPDDYMPIEPFGVPTEFSDRAPRTAVQYLPATADTAAGLKLLDPQSDGRMPAQLEALGIMRETFGDTLCLTGNVAAPFSSVALLCGVSETLLTVYDDADLTARFTDFFVEWQIAWGKAQIDAGAHAIWLGDCVAGSAFLSTDHFEQFALEPAKRVCAALKAHGGLVFYHTGDKSLPHLELMTRIEPDALSVGEGIDMAQVKATIGDRMCLLGNIDGMATLERGSPSDVERETRRIVEAGKPGGGYILNSGEGIPFDTPPENIAQMFETAREVGTYA
jgi:MtaA/CmuA family methyltransferase